MTTLKLAIIFLIFSTYLSNVLRAQDISSVNTKPLKSWEIGYDLLSLKEIFKPIDSDVNKHGFLLRRNYNNKAIRFKGSFFSRFNPDNIGSKNYEVRRSRVEIMLGHEWQKFVHPKFNIFYGGDIGYSWYRNKEAISDDPNGYTRFQVFRTYSQRALADAFIGARFFVIKNLSISMETALIADWSRAKGYAEHYAIQQDGNEILTGIDQDTGFTALNQTYRFSPLSTLYISYHF